MKSTIKSIVTFALGMLVISLFVSESSFAQGRGFGSKGIKPATGTAQGVNWVDANGDGICDIFVDANGDGINDNPQGYKGGSGVGRFGSASGVCDGTGKGRVSTGSSTQIRQSKSR